MHEFVVVGEIAVYGTLELPPVSGFQSLVVVDSSVVDYAIDMAEFLVYLLHNGGYAVGVIQIQNEGPVGIGIGLDVFAELVPG